MWYKQIITPLLEKINSLEKKDAEIFLKNFFASLYSLFKEEPPLETTLGIIDKLYAKFGDKPNESVELKDFSHTLLGLTIVYLKIAEEKAVYNVDLLPIFDTVQKYLVLNEKIIAPQENYKNPYDSAYVILAKAKTFILSELEKITLAELTFVTSVDLNHVLKIFSQSNYEAIRDFYERIIVHNNPSAKFIAFKNKIFSDYLKEKDQCFFEKLEKFKLLIDEITERIKHKSLKEIDPSIWQNLKFDEEVTLKYCLKFFTQLYSNDLKKIQDFYRRTVFLKGQNTEFDSLRKEIFKNYCTSAELELGRIAALANEFTEKAKTNSLSQLDPSNWKDFANLTRTDLDSFFILFEQLNSIKEIKLFYQKTEFLNIGNLNFSDFRNKIFSIYFTKKERMFYRCLNDLHILADKESQVALSNLKKLIINEKFNFEESDRLCLLTFFAKLKSPYLIRKFYEQSNFLSGKDAEFDDFRQEIFKKYFTGEEQLLSNQKNILQNLAYELMQQLLTNFANQTDLSILDKFDGNVDIDLFIKIFIEPYSIKEIESFYLQTEFLRGKNTVFDCIRKTIFNKYVDRQFVNALDTLAKKLSDDVKNNSFSELKRELSKKEPLSKKERHSQQTSKSHLPSLANFKLITGHTLLYFFAVFIRQNSLEELQDFYQKTENLTEDLNEGLTESLNGINPAFDNFRRVISEKIEECGFNRELDLLTNIAKELSEKAKTNALDQLQPILWENWDNINRISSEYFFNIFTQFNSLEEGRTFYRKTEILKGKCDKFDEFRQTLFLKYFTKEEKESYTQLDAIGNKLIEKNLIISEPFSQLKQSIINPSHFNSAIGNEILNLFAQLDSPQLIKSFYIKTEFLDTKNPEFKTFRKQIFDQNFTKEEKNFFYRLEIMDEKTEKLEEKFKKNPTKYTKAFNDAHTLCQKMRTAGNSYFKQQNKDSYTIFRQSCDKAIEAARPELENYRGWREILYNASLCVAGLGFIYGAAVGIHWCFTGRILFFQTDSAQKLDSLESSYKKIPCP